MISEEEVDVRALMAELADADPDHDEELVLITLYLHYDLPRALKDEFQARMASDARFRERVERVRLIRAVLGDCADEITDHALVELPLRAAPTRVLRVRGGSTRTRRTTLWLRAAAISGIAVMGGVGGASVLRVAEWRSGGGGERAVASVTQPASAGAHGTAPSAATHPVASGEPQGSAQERTAMVARRDAEGKGHGHARARPQLSATDVPPLRPVAVGSARIQAAAGSLRASEIPCDSVVGMRRMGLAEVARDVLRQMEIERQRDSAAKRPSAREFIREVADEVLSRKAGSAAKRAGEGAGGGSGMTPYVPTRGDSSSGPATAVPVAPNATNEADGANVQSMRVRKVCGRLGSGTTRP